MSNKELSEVLSELRSAKLSTKDRQEVGDILEGIANSSRRSLFEATFSINEYTLIDWLSDRIKYSPGMKAVYERFAKLVISQYPKGTERGSIQAVSVDTMTKDELNRYASGLKHNDEKSLIGAIPEIPTSKVYKVVEYSNAQSRPDDIYIVLTVKSIIVSVFVNYYDDSDDLEWNI